MKKLFYVVLFAFILSSCNNRKKDIVIAYFEKPITLTPNIINETTVSSVLNNFYNSLVEYDPFMKILPSLAYAWANPDDTTWIFYLRKNILFHDGDPFTAEDVKYTLEKIKNNPRSEFRKMIDGITNIKIIDDYRVKIITKTSDPNLLGKLTSIYMESKTTINDSSLNGTGPLVEETIMPDKITTIPFQQYWGDKLKCHHVVIKFYSDYRKLIEDYKAGSLDLVGESNYFMLDSFRNYNQLIVKGVESILRYMAFNTRQYPFSNRYFRKAISFAIDRDKMARVIYKGLATPANQYAIPFVSGFDLTRTNKLYNLDSARYYIKKSGVKLPIKVRILASYRRIDMINFLSGQLTKIGITVVPDTLKAPELFRRIDRGNFDMFLLASIPDYPDLSDMLNGLFYSNIKGQSSHNRAGYSNRKVDSILDILNGNQTSSNRIKMEWKVQDIILNDMPIIPLVYEKNYYIVSDRIEYTPRSDNLVTIKEIKLK